MSSSLAIIGGGARTGKDTVGALIASRTNGQCIAQADPMKRLMALTYEFTEETLWGPSEARNAVDPRYRDYADFRHAEDRLAKASRPWLRDVLPGLSNEEIDRADEALRLWAYNLGRFHVDTGKDFTCRYALQTLGTEWGRAFSKNMWVDYADRTAQAMLGGGYRYNRASGLTDDRLAKPPGLVIITDGRFPNEVSAVKAHAGLAIEIQAPEAGIDPATQAAGVRNHASETSLSDVPRHWWDYVVVNDKSKGLKFLSVTIDMLVDRLTHNITFR